MCVCTFVDACECVRYILHCDRYKYEQACPSKRTRYPPGVEAHKSAAHVFSTSVITIDIRSVVADINMVPLREVATAMHWSDPQKL